MPQKSAPELFAVVHYLHRLSTEGKRGAKWYLESRPGQPSNMLKVC